MTQIDKLIPKLPYGWNPMTIVTLAKWTNDNTQLIWKLTYPMTLRLRSGETMTFQNYEEHHQFIHNTFLPCSPSKMSS